MRAQCYPTQYQGQVFWGHRAIHAHLDHKEASGGSESISQACSPGNPEATELLEPTQSPLWKAALCAKAEYSRSAGSLLQEALQPGD